MTTKPMIMLELRMAMEMTPFKCDVCMDKVSRLCDATMHAITARLMGFNFDDKPKNNGIYDIKVCEECRDIKRRNNATE